MPEVSTIRDTNDHLCTNARARLVPRWAARYYDRVPGAPRGHRDSSPSPERTAGDSRERDRPSSQSNRKQTSPSPEERYVSLRPEGLLGLPPAEVAGAVSAALAHPTTVPDWALHEGSCSVVVPHEAWRRASRGSDSHPAETASGAYVLIGRKAQDHSQHVRWQLSSRSPARRIRRGRRRRAPVAQRGPQVELPPPTQPKALIRQPRAYRLRPQTVCHVQGPGIPVPAKQRALTSWRLPAAAPWATSNRKTAAQGGNAAPHHGGHHSGESWQKNPAEQTVRPQ